MYVMGHANSIYASSSNRELMPSIPVDLLAESSLKVSDAVTYYTNRYKMMTAMYQQATIRFKIIKNTVVLVAEVEATEVVVSSDFSDKYNNNISNNKMLE